MEMPKRLFILRYAKGTITEDALAKIRKSLPPDSVFVPVEYVNAGGGLVPGGHSVPMVDVD